MQKRLPLPDRPITVLSTCQTGETLLDETLRMMKQTEDAGEKMGVGTWVDLLSGAYAISSLFHSFCFCSVLGYFVLVHTTRFSFYFALHIAGWNGVVRTSPEWFLAARVFAKRTR
ncbi:hypothetical protein B0H16DRAFT_984472 [Mycena metata]|uniref:Uncharacterized protein n=1 Tax=Mycena metata TaxID=1033252 RepID=A0AAD7N472_9AGAR|nr:hypothetical protein B0H16DRAFT_984472 [Mycena metata]